MTLKTVKRTPAAHRDLVLVALALGLIFTALAAPSQAATEREGASMTRHWGN